MTRQEKIHYIERCQQAIIAIKTEYEQILKQAEFLSGVDPLLLYILTYESQVRAMQLTKLRGDAYQLLYEFKNVIVD